jgi:hypothetical protein
MAIDLPRIERHPNRVSFRGVLTLVDVPSDKPPAGARGHRVMLTRTAAEKALPSLLGMGLDYAPSWDRHDARRKIGVITQTEVVPLEAGPGCAIEVSGYLYGKDFPEVVRELRSTGRAVMGMSYEIADASIEELNAPVWSVTGFTFTGAALLRRDKAAYQKTWAELSQ